MGNPIKRTGRQRVESVDNGSATVDAGLGGEITASHEYLWPFDFFRDGKRVRGFHGNATVSRAQDPISRSLVKSVMTSAVTSVFV
jgi:hypothetical protein